ncbi:MAG: phosphatidylserine decarboxylase [Acidobacteria bacterium RBG_16_68_9]|nr:MAG: phosphatidylserine decarboxylase [Acidobacteria bacterium RBG_16_68_9]
MAVAQEGYPRIVAAFALAVALWWLAGPGGGVVGAMVVLLVLRFFRDPERTIPTDSRFILAPADGRVVKAEAVQDERFLKRRALQVSIFMSPLDVHVNRNPVGGRVVDVRYHPGRYFRAFADKASLDNEQNAVVVEDEQGRPVAFVQIAGFLARRIVCYLRTGMRVVRGARCGIIMFGSRVDVFLPTEAQLRISVGARTRAGETVIAEWTT